MPSTKRRSFSEPGLAALLLLLWPCVLGYLFSRTLETDSYLPLLILLAVPAVATGLTMLSIAIAPTLLPKGRVKFPANFTLPMIFAVMLTVCVITGSSTGSSLVTPSTPLTLAGFWLHWQILAVVALAQFISLSILAAISPAHTE